MLLWASHRLTELPHSDLLNGNNPVYPVSYQIRWHEGCSINTGTFCLCLSHGASMVGDPLAHALWPLWASVSSWRRRMVLQAKAFVNEAGGSLCRSREMGRRGLWALESSSRIKSYTLSWAWKNQTMKPALQKPQLWIFKIETEVGTKSP